MERNDEFGQHFIDAAEDISNLASIPAIRDWSDMARALIMRRLELADIPQMNNIDTREIENLLPRSHQEPLRELRRLLQIYKAMENFAGALADGDQRRLITASRQVGQKIKRLRTFYYYHEDARRGVRVQQAASKGGRQRSKNMDSLISRRDQIIQEIANAIWHNNLSLSRSECAKKVVQRVNQNQHEFVGEIQSLLSSGVRIPSADTIRRKLRVHHK